MSCWTVAIAHEIFKRLHHGDSQTCPHGAIAYPRNRRKNSRIQAVKEGKLVECCRDTDTTHVFLGLPVSEETKHGD